MNPSFLCCSFMFVEASVDIARLIRASFVPQFEFDFSFYEDLKRGDEYKNKQCGNFSFIHFILRCLSGPPEPRNHSPQYV